MARPAAVKQTAKPAAKRGTRPGARRRPRNGGLLTLSVVALIGLAVTALPLCILLIVGLPPTAVAIIVDRHPRRYLARTVGAMNIAGVLPSAHRLWHTDMSFASLTQVIGSPYAWLVMYGAAGIGWLLYFGMPPLINLIGEVRADDRRRELETRAKALVEEWGTEVTGRAEEREAAVSSAADAGPSPTP